MMNKMNIMNKPQFLNECLKVATEGCKYYHPFKQTRQGIVEHYCELSLDNHKPHSSNTITEPAPSHSILNHVCLFSRPNCFCEAIVSAGTPRFVAKTETMFVPKMPFKILVEASGRVRPAMKYNTSKEERIAGVALPNTKHFRVCEGCKRKLIEVRDNEGKRQKLCGSCR